MPVTATRVQLTAQPLINNNGIKTPGGQTPPFVIPLGSFFTTNIQGWPQNIPQVAVSAYLWLSNQQHWFATLVFTSLGVGPPTIACGETYALGLPNNQYSPSLDPQLIDELRKAFW